MSAINEKYLSDSVTLIAKQLTDGHAEEAYFALLHHENVQLPSELKPILFDGFVKCLPETGKNGARRLVDIAQLLELNGAVNFVFMDPILWTDKECMITATIAGCLKRLPVVDAEMLRTVDSFVDDTDCLELGMDVEGVVAYDNESDHWSRLTDLTIWGAEEGTVIDVIDGQTRVLRDVFVRTWSGDGSVSYDCWINDGGHDLYDVTLAIGERPKFELKNQPV